jgi:hypothetical protein
MRNRTAVLLLVLLAVAAAAPAADQKTLTGKVTDTMCGAKHAMGGSDADCTRECVKGGSKYGLVVGDKVYTLAGHEADLDKLAGQKVTVKGDVKGDTVQVAAVAAAK